MERTLDMTNLELIHGGSPLDVIRFDDMIKEESKEIINNKEAVNHPSHYNREGSMECIDEMLLIFGAEAVKNFCLCNAWKYRYRAADKNGEEDLKKSDWYMNKYQELIKLYGKNG